MVPALVMLLVLMAAFLDIVVHPRDIVVQPTLVSFTIVIITIILHVYYKYMMHNMYPYISYNLTYYRITSYASYYLQ